MTLELEDDAKDRWRECRACGCPIGDTDELCRSLTCHMYGKQALAPANARSVSTFTTCEQPLISAYCSSGQMLPPAQESAFWDQLIEGSIF